MDLLFPQNPSMRKLPEPIFEPYFPHIVLAISLNIVGCCGSDVSSNWAGRP
jgi:hypothetical protein